MAMFNLNAGTGRRADNPARPQTTFDPAEFVRQTLARHGLDATMASPSSQNVGGLYGQPGAAKSPNSERKNGDFVWQSHRGSDGTRRFATYVPGSLDGAPRGLIMMLHGCTQTVPDFAAGTDMNTLADKHGLIIVYPEQTRAQNPNACWSWFARKDQQRGRGEPEILAGILARAAQTHGVRADRCFVAGLSAGGAMALVLGQTYPELIGAVGVHSGLAYGVARDVRSAFAAMGGNPTVTSEQALRTRTVVFHGSADSTVVPSNADLIARQVEAAHPQTVMTETKGSSGGRPFVRRIVSEGDGQTVLESWRIEGLGHAWSGGSRRGSHTDPGGPDASAEMVRFFFQTEDDQSG